MTNLNLFIPITKVDAKQRLVYGTLTEEVPDKAGEIFDYATGKEAFQKWSGEIEKSTSGKSKGNLRAMHDNIAAGKFTDIVFDDVAKRIEGVAKVVDDNEWRKVEEGVYTGFSIGGGYAKRWTDPSNPQLKRFTPTLAEVSLVDSPCVPTATFEFIKEDGSKELRKFNVNHEVAMSEEEQKIEKADTADTPEAAGATDTKEDATEADSPVEKSERPQDKGGVVQGFQAKDGSFHLKKADALARNVAYDAEQLAAPALEALQKLDDAVTKAEGQGEEAAAASDEAADAPAADHTPSEAAPEAEPAEKAAHAEEVKKGMYGVSRFAELLQSILHLQQDVQWETEFEGDKSKIAKKLKSWLADGGTLLQAMCAEEVAELTASKSAGGDDDDLNKGAALERDALRKVLNDLTPKLETLVKRIEVLERQPLPAKGNLRVVSKAEDSGNVSDGDAEKRAAELLKSMTPEEQSMVLMKAALSLPKPMTRS